VDQRIEKMHALYRTGSSLRTVGAEFGISAERVRQLFRDNGLRTRSRKEQRALLKDKRERQKRAETGRDDKTPRPPSAWVEKKYTDEELLEVLRETSEALGGILTTHAYNHYAEGHTFPDGRPWPSHQTHFHRFGSWRQSLLSAGLAANPSSAISGQRIFDRSQCIDAVRHVGRELNGRPSLKQYEMLARKSNGGLPSAATVRNRCGSWSEALRLAFHP
jgi:Homing endonuclease associated repeat